MLTERGYEEMLSLQEDKLATTAIDFEKAREQLLRREESEF
jgi:hypothetical protein